MKKKKNCSVVKKNCEKDYPFYVDTEIGNSSEGFFFFKVSSLMKVVYVVLFIHLYFAGLASTNIVDKHADFKRQ